MQPFDLVIVGAGFADCPCLSREPVAKPILIWFFQDSPMNAEMRLVFLGHVLKPRAKGEWKQPV